MKNSDNQNSHTSGVVKNLVSVSQAERPEFLQQATSDQLVDVMLRLAMEISVIRDRLDIYEAIAEEEGIDISRIEKFEADDELIQKRTARRQGLVNKIIDDMR